MHTAVKQDLPVNGLSESVIPAVPGEFYRYSTVFTAERPLFVFMKCKANKDRSLSLAAELGRECNLVFLFGNPAHVCSIKTAHTAGLLDDSINGDPFGETWIASAGITPADFHGLRAEQDTAALVSTCRKVCSEHMTSIDLQPGSVYAVMTDAGKYGMFLVEEITPASITIIACHILL